MNLKPTGLNNPQDSSRRPVETFGFVELVVSMSFPKAPLKRFNDPSGAYGEKCWGTGYALTPLVLLGFPSSNRRFLRLGWGSLNGSIFLKHMLSFYYLPSTIQVERITVSEAKSLLRGV